MLTESRKTASSSCTGPACKKGPVYADDKLSRREFFKLSRRESGVIPVIRQELCPSPEGCRICTGSCGAHAIHLRGGKIRIDPDRCVGCGTCTVACPRAALVYPGFTPGQADLEIERLLQEAADRDSRIIVFACAGKKSDPVVYPRGLLPVVVPCLSMVTAWLILRAFSRGAQGAVLVPAVAGCGLNGETADIRFVRELFRAWSIEPLRIHVWGGAKGELEGFVRAVEDFPVLRLTGIQAVPGQEKELPLAAIIRAMEKTLGSSVETGLGKGIAPFGIVRIDAQQCTGCGLCSLNCPTGALSFGRRSGDDSYQILFRHDRCVGCGICRKSCPEKAVGVERILHIDKLGQPAEILLEGRLSSCRECGAPLFPQAMVLRLKARLSAAGGSAWAVDLCPACRLKTPLIAKQAIDACSKEITP
jgi:ferredoxin/coenzyme F420-reducing hydrogenase delta subunit